MGITNNLKKKKNPRNKKTTKTYKPINKKIKAKIITMKMTKSNIIMMKKIQKTKTIKNNNIKIISKIKNKTI